MRKLILLLGLLIGVLYADAQSLGIKVRRPAPDTAWVRLHNTLSSGNASSVIFIMDSTQRADFTLRTDSFLIHSTVPTNLGLAGADNTVYGINGSLTGNRVLTGAGYNLDFTGLNDLTADFDSMKLSLSDSAYLISGDTAGLFTEFLKYNQGAEYTYRNGIRIGVVAGQPNSYFTGFDAFTGTDNWLAGLTHLPGLGNLRLFTVGYQTVGTGADKRVLESDIEWVRLVSRESSTDLAELKLNTGHMQLLADTINLTNNNSGSPIFLIDGTPGNSGEALMAVGDSIVWQTPPYPTDSNIYKFNGALTSTRNFDNAGFKLLFHSGEIGFDSTVVQENEYQLKTTVPTALDIQDAANDTLLIGSGMYRYHLYTDAEDTVTVRPSTDQSWAVNIKSVDSVLVDTIWVKFLDFAGAVSRIDGPYGGLSGAGISVPLARGDAIKIYYDPAQSIWFSEFYSKREE